MWVAAGVLRVRPVLYGMATVSAVLSALLLLQFERNPRGVLVGGFTGGNGSTLSFFIGVTLVGLVLGGVPRRTNAIPASD